MRPKPPIPRDLIGKTHHIKKNKNLFEIPIDRNPPLDYKTGLSKFAL